MNTEKGYSLARLNVEMDEINILAFSVEDVTSILG